MVLLNKKVEKKEIVLLNKKVETILSFWGFKKFFSYEKERANFAWGNCAVSLDKLGADYYIEIEGEEAEINKVISRLNLEKKTLEKRSYLEILGGEEDGLYRKSL